MGQAGLAEPAVAAARRVPAGLALEQQHVALGVALLGEQRGPQPEVAAAHDDEVGGVRAVQRGQSGQGAGRSGSSSQYGVVLAPAERGQRRRDPVTRGPSPDAAG